MGNHIHTGVISITVNAIGTLVVWHVLRAVAGQMAASDRPFLATTGKTVGGLLTLK